MDGLTLINDAEKMGEDLARNRITVSQLRKFLSAVNGISNKIEAVGEMNEKAFNEIQYLRVKLAYQTGRETNIKKRDCLKVFKTDLDTRIKAIKTREDFETFARYIEAIIAYHKFNGGN